MLVLNSPGGTRHHALPQKCYFCFSQTIIVIPLFPAAHGAAFFLRPATQGGVAVRPCGKADTQTERGLAAVW
ncbi:hypothetical protein QTN27_23105 [Escherichia coli]|nr:hypothetical protein [Escherichia coli]MDP7680705.1 hypothetical protein [Escherichia coli]